MTNQDYMDVPCHICGKPAKIYDPKDETLRHAVRRMARCPECQAKFEADQERIRRENAVTQYWTRMDNSGINYEFIKDRNTGGIMEQPIPQYRNIVQWIGEHSDSNIILSGITGSGKTTSACFVANKICWNWNAIPCYMTMAELLSSYVNTKRDERSNVNTLIREMSHYTHFIIDECIGKFKITPTCQEFLFLLVDAIYSHRINTKVWMLGNFYCGAVRSLFADPDPAVRRLNEINWVRGIIMPTGKISEVMI